MNSGVRAAVFLLLAVSAASLSGLNLFLWYYAPTVEFVQAVQLMGWMDIFMPLSFAFLFGLVLLFLLNIEHFLAEYLCPECDFHSWSQKDLEEHFREMHGSPMVEEVKGSDAS